MFLLSTGFPMRVRSLDAPPSPASPGSAGAEIEAACASTTLESAPFYKPWSAFSQTPAQGPVGTSLRGRPSPFWWAFCAWSTLGTDIFAWEKLALSTCQQILPAWTISCAPSAGTHMCWRWPPRTRSPSRTCPLQGGTKPVLQVCLHYLAGSPMSRTQAPS